MIRIYFHTWLCIYHLDVTDSVLTTLYFFLSAQLCDYSIVILSTFPTSAMDVGVSHLIAYTVHPSLCPLLPPAVSEVATRLYLYLSLKAMASVNNSMLLLVM